MKAIVVNQGIPGTAAAFKKIREKRKDILLLCGNSHEDPATIEQVADFISDPDDLMRGYLIPLCAKKLGAKNFVHLSFDRHMRLELLAGRRDIMRLTCENSGINFYSEDVLDPMSDFGVEGARKNIEDRFAGWLEKYGKETAFFATNDAQAAPLIKCIAESGAYFIQQDLPSPILGYLEAFDLDLEGIKGDWPMILAEVEEAVSQTAGNKRMGTWAYSYGYSCTQALTEFAKQICEKRCSQNLEALLECYRMYTPKADWNGSLYKNKESKQAASNHALVYQDTYVFGLGFMNMTKEDLPDVYELLAEAEKNN